MRVRNAFLALAATLAAFATTGVGVSPAFARGTDVVAVGYGDLNLASAAGRRALDNRIEAAIDLVCNDGDSAELRANAQERACRVEATAAALPQRDAAIGGQRRGIVRVSAAAN
jgi:UrcA family protein